MFPARSRDSILLCLFRFYFLTRISLTKPSEVICFGWHISAHVCMHLLHQRQREKQQCALTGWSLVDCEGLLDRDQARYSCWGICNRGSLSCGFGHAGSWKMAQCFNLFQEWLVWSQGSLQTKHSVIVNLNHSLQRALRRNYWFVWGSKVLLSKSKER